MREAMIIWIYGLSGVGKSTIGRSLAKHIRERQTTVIEIDGDMIREMFGNDLGFDLKSREIQIERIQKLAKALERQYPVIIVTALFANQSLTERNRRLFTNYFEIYLSAPLETLYTRDTKGLYSKVKSGKTKNVVGVDLEWKAPETQDLQIDTSITSLEDSTSWILSRLKFTDL